MACPDDDSARPANCFARGFARLTVDNHKWHRHRKYRVPRLRRRLPTRASAYSGLHVFVPLAWTPSILILSNSPLSLAFPTFSRLRLFPSTVTLTVFSSC